MITKYLPRPNILYSVRSTTTIPMRCGTEVTDFEFSKENNVICTAMFKFISSVQALCLVLDHAHVGSIARNFRFTLNRTQWMDMRFHGIHTLFQWTELCSIGPQFFYRPGLDLVGFRFGILYLSYTLMGIGINWGPLTMI